MMPPDPEICMKWFSVNEPTDFQYLHLFECAYKKLGCFPKTCVLQTEFKNFLVKTYVGLI